MAKSNCIVFNVSSSDEQMNSFSIEEHFGKFGKVITCRLYKSRRGGFVVFETLEEAEYALMTPEHIVDDCLLNLHSARRDFSARL